MSELFEHFSQVNSLRINPEMLKYLNDYTKKQIDNACENHKYKYKYGLLCRDNSNPNLNPENNVKMLVVVGLVSFLAGCCLRQNICG